VTGLWFSPVSSTNKTDCPNITEILLKVVLNTINQTTLKYTEEEPWIRIIIDYFFISCNQKMVRTHLTNIIEFSSMQINVSENRKGNQEWTGPRQSKHKNTTQHRKLKWRATRTTKNIGKGTWVLKNIHVSVILIKLVQIWFFFTVKIAY